MQRKLSNETLGDLRAQSDHGGPPEECVERFTVDLRATVEMQTPESLPNFLVPAPERWWQMAYKNIEAYHHPWRWEAASFLRPWFSGIKFFLRSQGDGEKGAP